MGERESERVCVCVCVSYVTVYGRESEREREGERAIEREEMRALKDEWRELLLALFDFTDDPPRG